MVLGGGDRVDRVVRVVIALVLAAHAVLVQAADWLVGSGLSYHLDRNGQNELNTGIGVERALANGHRVVAGVYHNSSRRLSAYVADAYTPWPCLGARCGAILGGATGYEQGQKPAVLGGFAATLERGRRGLNLIFIPAAGGVLFVQVKWRLD